MAEIEGSESKKKSILVLHGPNLSKLGKREPHIYGETSLNDINRHLEEMALLSDISLESIQSNHEGVLIDCIEVADEKHDAIIFNPGGLTHTSYSLRDAIAGCTVPVIEVHLTNLSAREEFRSISVISSVCCGTVTGFGYYSYLMALWYLISHLE